MRALINSPLSKGSACQSLGITQYIKGVCKSHQALVMLSFGLLSRMKKGSKYCQKETFKKNSALINLFILLDILKQKTKKQEVVAALQVTISQLVQILPQIDTTMDLKNNVFFFPKNKIQLRLETISVACSRMHQAKPGNQNQSQNHNCQSIRRPLPSLVYTVDMQKST